MNNKRMRYFVLTKNGPSAKTEAYCAADRITVLHNFAAGFFPRHIIEVNDGNAFLHLMFSWIVGSAAVFDGSSYYIIKEIKEDKYRN